MNMKMLVALLSVLAVFATGQQPSSDSPRMKGLLALEGFFKDSTENAIDTFLEEKIAPSLLEKHGKERLQDLLMQLRSEFEGLEVEGGRPVGPFSARMLFSGESKKGRNSLEFDISSQPPHRLTFIDFEGPTAADVSGTLLERFEARLDQLVSRGIFSGAVQLAQGSEVVFEKAYGMADRQGKQANRIDTKFNVGSMNKMFTAVAILQLAQQGKLDLQRPLAEAWPDYPNPEVAAKVTLHQLLTHTSGMGDYLGKLFQRQANDVLEVSDYLPLFVDDPLQFEPGAKWSYSNAGFMVLGGVIEKVSGQSYFEYVRQHIFEPAGMKDTGFAFYESPKISGLAVQYSRMRGKDGQEAPFVHPGKGGPAGGGYSTVGDWVRFGQALQSNRLLNSEMTRLLTEGKVEVGRGRRYAYGISDERTPGGLRIVGHGGGAPGINGELGIYWDRGWILSALSNIDPPSASQVKEAFEELLEAQK